MKTSILYTALAGFGALLSGCVVTSPAPDKQTIDAPSRSAPGETVEGLVRVPSKQVDAVYVARGATLAPYRRVMLDSVEIAFKADWQKRHPEVAAADITRFRSQGSAVFFEIFSAALSMNDGYPLTTQPGPDVLRVSASITELDVATSPGTGGNLHGYVVSPGDMTLIMDPCDSLTGATLAHAIDREKGRTFGNLQVASEVATSSEARRALEMWAGLLRNALDAARSGQDTAQAPKT